MEERGERDRAEAAVAAVRQRETQYQRTLKECRDLLEFQDETLVNLQTQLAEAEAAKAKLEAKLGLPPSPPSAPPPGLTAVPASAASAASAAAAAASPSPAYPVAAQGKERQAPGQLPASFQKTLRAVEGG
eukprot:1188516-Prorocentrum_minimum.AAC.1